jgi:IclR family pca regulon transcriptional regulator
MAGRGSRRRLSIIDTSILHFTMKRTPRKPTLARARDPLFNRSVEKALAILGAFGGERRALSLAELAVSVGITTSSAQRCVHTLVRLGFLRRDPQAKRCVLTPRALALAHAYLAGHALLEQATTHLIDLNQASGESVSLSEPDGTDMVFIARFPSLKPFHIHMPVGRRLPMYCTASGRAYLSALPAALARRILGRSRPAALTPTTLTDPQQIWKRIQAARKSGYAWSDQEYYRGDVTIAAPVLGEDGEPLAALNISAPTSRWTLAQLRAKLAPLLLQSAQAASLGSALQSQRRLPK